MNSAATDDRSRCAPWGGNIENAVFSDAKTHKIWDVKSKRQSKVKEQNSILFFFFLFSLELQILVLNCFAANGI